MAKPPAEPWFEMMDLDEQTKLKSVLCDHEVNVVSLQSPHTEKSETRSLPAYVHVPFKLFPYVSLPSPQSSLEMGSPTIPTTISSSLRVPSPTPLAKSGVKVVKSISLKEIANSVHSDTCSSLLSLLLPLAGTIETSNACGPSLYEDESLCRMNGPSYNSTDIEDETRANGAVAAEFFSSNNSLSSGLSVQLSEEETGPQFHNDSMEDQLQTREQWNRSFASLVEYKKQFGNCNVPYLWKNNKPLSQWVKRQRHQKKLKVQGRRSNMSDYRENLLNGIGFCWDSRDAAWDERFQELQLFYRRNGHCRVPRSNHPTLSVWLKRQRHQCRHFFSGILDGPDNTITATRIEKLLELGVDLNLNLSTS